MSLNVMSELENCSSAICELIMLSTSLEISLSLWFFNEREAASTASTIITTAVSLENGLGPR